MSTNPRDGRGSSSGPPPPPGVPFRPSSPGPDSASPCAGKKVDPSPSPRNSRAPRSAFSPVSTARKPRPRPEGEIASLAFPPPTLPSRSTAPGLSRLRGREGLRWAFPRVSAPRPRPCPCRRGPRRSTPPPSRGLAPRPMRGGREGRREGDPSVRRVPPRGGTRTTPRSPRGDHSTRRQPPPSRRPDEGLADEDRRRRVEKSSSGPLLSRLTTQGRTPPRLATPTKPHGIEGSSRKRTGGRGKRPTRDPPIAVSFRGVGTYENRPPDPCPPERPRQGQGPREPRPGKMRRGHAEARANGRPPSSSPSL